MTSEIAQANGKIEPPVDEAIDLVEWYFEQGWTDGLPVVPPYTGKGCGNGIGFGREP